MMCLNKRGVVAGALAVCVFLVVAVAASARSGGSSTAASVDEMEANGGTLAFANIFENTEVFQGLRKSVQAAGEKTGWKVLAYDNNNTADQTLANGRLMVQQRPDVIADFNPIAAVGNQLGRMFNQAKIPCIAIIIPFEGCPRFSQDNLWLANDMAKTLAKLMKQRGWNGKNSIMVFMGNADAGRAVNIETILGYVRVSQLVPFMEKRTAKQITASTTSIGQTGLQLNNPQNNIAGAYSVMKAALQTIPKNRHIVFTSINDDFTIGVGRALKEAGRNDVMITGFGCDSQAITALRSDPRWVADTCNFIGSWGPYLVAMSQALKNGVKPPVLTVSPQTTLTKANVNSYFGGGAVDAPTSLPPLDPRSKYLAKTGILQQFHLVRGLK